MHFEKMHGCRNDFVVTSIEELSFFSLDFLREMARRICDRRSGVGADAWIIWSKPSLSQPFVEILLLNSDGSLAGTCGNALRCVGLSLLRQGLWDGVTRLPVARWVPDIHETLAADESFASVREVFGCILSGQMRGFQGEISVGMGIEKSITATPHFSAEQISIARTRMGDLNTWQSLTGTFVELANPHWIFLSRDFACFSQDQLCRFGQLCQNELKLFGNMCLPVANIGMLSPLQPESFAWKLVVYERGAGLTEGCGSGATAARAALEYLEIIPIDAPEVTFQMPGGRLSVTWDENQAERVLSGEAVIVNFGDLV